MDKLEECRQLVGELAGIRTEREEFWREASRWICPWRGCLEDGERGAYQDSEEGMRLFTGAASRALLAGASGMTSGMTPRNISWFKPEFSDPELAEVSGAREWLDRLDSAMKGALSSGGFYQAIHNFNIDLIWSGCGLLFCEKSRAAPLRFECVQIGSFYISLDENGRLDTAARLAALPAAAAARKFGEKKLCRKSRAMLNKNPYHKTRIWHLCRPAEKGPFAWASHWWEEDGTDFLEDGAGFHEMPYFFTSWNESATPYGSGPGDLSIADARQLDILERNKLGGLGRLADPPVSALTQLKDVLDLSPGAINYMPSHDMVRPILDISPYAQAVRHVQEEIATVTKRLEDSLMASIFSSVPMEFRPQGMTATEFMERKREALQKLGPVISAYEPNVLDPVLRRTLLALEREGGLPKPPEGLRDYRLPMKIEFISPMANALRQSGLEAARALLQDAAAMYEVTGNVEIYDKIDLDQSLDELAHALGAPGGMIRSDEDAAAIRQARADEQAQAREAERAAQMLQMGKAAADIAKTGAEINGGMNGLPS